MKNNYLESTWFSARPITQFSWAVFVLGRQEIQIGNEHEIMWTQQNLWLYVNRANDYVGKSDGLLFKSVYTVDG